MKKLYFLDLFCGAGGTSQGIARACEKRGLDYWLTAVNHWDAAVATHKANHIGSHHNCDIYGLEPKLMVPGGHVDLMCASPECIYHSNARGSGPCNEQSRSAADELLHWLTDLDVDWLMVENVAEFINWGPLDKKGNPIKKHKGVYFNNWIQRLTLLGYDFKFSVLNAADYGAYTARKRFFLIATKTGEPISFPEKTHEGKWNPAKDIIDWTLDGSSIFTRDKPLVKNSMRRVCHGLKKFNNIDLDLDYAMKCAEKGELPVIKYQEELVPFLTKYNGGAVPRTHSIAEPLRTVDTSNRFALLTPFFSEMYGTSRSRSIDRPVSSIVTIPKQYLCEPYIMPQHQGYDKMNVRSIHQPLQTITTTGCEAILSPYLTKYYGTSMSASIDQPLGTVTTKDTFALLEPTLVDCRLDVDYRLMEAYELAAAMGFPEDYIWPVGKTAKKKLIGNAVECNQSEALVTTILEQHVRSVA